MLFACSVFVTVEIIRVFFIISEAQRYNKRPKYTNRFYLCDITFSYRCRISVSISKMKKA
ncbi:hypothetical protein HMPREF1981_00442 [Bacteroides pyogenes F0041]|uniref:Uncharacterized protein n=1 Tax=Bacteroides pyogenes F0041 TaxID=1321819 RepID=U2E837_9BACE|nr:hypothetical protein HMPREF1981_00442 [Bacteroides pyogenes F0041]